MSPNAALERLDCRAWFEPRGFRRRRFNLDASSDQANPNKTKQNCLDFLGFIRPNRDFSKGYGQKK
jgi:hypothetical protein